MIKLVATDVDGTLLRSDNTVSDRTRAAIKDATAAGIVLAFVTGRPPRWLHVLTDETGHVGDAVCANGAVLYDMANDELISVHALEPATVRRLGEELRRAFPKVRLAVEYGNGFAAEPDYVHDWQVNPTLDRHGVPMPQPRLGALSEIADRPIVKLLVKEREVDPDVLLTAALDLVGTRATITHSSSYGLLEVSAPGVTKATGLDELARRFDITVDEIAAIGDMPNDIAMLEWAGCSYAVANAHPAARAAAQHTTVSNDEDAVALLIESVLAEQT